MVDSFASDLLTIIKIIPTFTNLNLLFLFADIQHVPNDEGSPEDGLHEAGHHQEPDCESHES